MRCASGLLAALLTAGALAGPAQARQGTGLYAPFPSPAGGSRAEHFVGELGVATRHGMLAAGGRVAGEPGEAAARSGKAASGRAGTAGDTSAGLVLGLVVAALLGLGGLILVGRGGRSPAA